MKLTYKLMELPFEFAFTISRSTNTVARTVLVELSTFINGQEHTGLGESVPSIFYGEDAESVMAFYDQVNALNLLADLDPFNIQSLEERLERIPGNLAAKSGIDMAMLDLQGRILGIPLYKLWGLDPTRVPKSSYTIGIADMDLVRRKTETALARGYDVLKVKLGSANDLEILSLIRSMAPDAAIRVDANAAWRVDHAVEMCRAMRDFGVEFVEEPLLQDSTDEDYERLFEESPILLMADESCHTLGDIPRCARLFGSINLKHTKTGGLSEAKRMIHAARAHGLKIMLGGFGESSVSTTAFAHLGPLVDYADLDGSLLLAEDPFEGIIFDGSHFTLPSRPGIGIIPRQ